MAINNLLSSITNDYTLIDGMPLACLLIDRDHLTILHANPLAEKLLNQNSEAIVGKAIMEFIPTLSRSAWRDALTENKTRIRCQFVPPDSQLLHYLTVHFKPLFLGNNASYILVLKSRAPWQKSMDARRKSLRHLELAQVVAQLGSWEYYPASNRLLLSTSALSILDMLRPDTAATSTSLDHLFAKIDDEDRYQLVENLPKSKYKEPFELTCRLRLILDIERRILIRGERIRQGFDEDVVIGCCMDPTDQINMKFQVYKRDQQYRQLYTMKQAKR